MIWGRIKTWVIGVLVALMPVVYVFGRRDGDKEREIEFLRNSAETNDEIADFYRQMGEFSNEDLNLHTRRGLTDRLRNEGL